MEARVAAYVNKSYKYGFNGKEGDVESFSQCIAFEARIYDSRLGRWYSTDPEQVQFPHISPYAFANDNPVIFIDRDGEIPFWVVKALLEAGVGAFVDFTIQYSMNLITYGGNHETAMDKINWWQVARSGVEAASPSFGLSDQTKAILSGVGDITANYLNGKYRGMSDDQMLNAMTTDLLVGAGSYILGKEVFNRIAKYFKILRPTPTPPNAPKSAPEVRNTPTKTQSSSTTKTKTTQSQPPPGPPAPSTTAKPNKTNTPSSNQVNKPEARKNIFESGDVVPSRNRPNAKPVVEKMIKPSSGNIDDAWQQIRNAYPGAVPGKTKLGDPTLTVGPHTFVKKGPGTTKTQYVTNGKYTLKVTGSIEFHSKVDGVKSYKLRYGEVVK